MSSGPHSVLVLGASGSGKSTLLRTALEAEGGGVALLAPGNDELGSYQHLQDDPAYYVRGFDDPEFLPAVGLRKPSGLVMLIKTLVGIGRRMREPDPPPYRVAVLDTFDGAASLVVSVALAKIGDDIAPKARSSEGAEYYTSLQNLFAQLMRALRTLRDDHGMHLLVASHITKREATETGAAGAAGDTLTASVPGSFRDQLPGIFDFVTYAQTRRGPGGPPHFLTWVPDSRRPTKSRLGPLDTTQPIANDWQTLKPLLDGAAEARRAQHRAKLDATKSPA